MKCNAQFSLEACRSMLAMCDRNRNGKIDYSEFREMWRQAMVFKATFNDISKKPDSDNGLTEEELDSALQKLGYEVNPKIITTTFKRYANKSGKVVNVDDYVQICCRIKSLYGKVFSTLYGKV